MGGNEDEGLVTVLLEVFVEGKNYKGRPRLQYSKQIIDEIDCTNYEGMKRLAEHK